MGRRSDIRPLPSAERLRELFSYDSETGDLVWKIIPCNFRRAKPGDIAGRIGPKGYRIIGVDRSYYYAHRLIWKIITDCDPVDQIDHIDGNRLNNKFENLREAANGPNLCNAKLRKDNKSGFKGVCWEHTHKAWKAYISHNGKQFKLGRFKHLSAAVEAVRRERERLHGEYARAA